MIIDTNVYDAFRRGEPGLLRVSAEATQIALPLPVIAELKAGFLKGSLTGRNMNMLRVFMDQPVVSVLVPTTATADIYAVLQSLCWKQGRALSNNDIWIAALAREDDDVLVTYDKDFIVFQELFGEKLRILA